LVDLRARELQSSYWPGQKAFGTFDGRHQAFDLPLNFHPASAYGTIGVRSR
jgi:hypothetical protein